MSSTPSGLSLELSVVQNNDSPSSSGDSSDSMRLISNASTDSINDMNETLSEEQVRKKTRDVHRFVELAEETRRNIKCFSKALDIDAPVDWKDWTHHHFFGKYIETGQIVLTTYDLDEELIQGSQHLPAHCWLKIPRPRICAEEKMTVPKDDIDLRYYLEFVRSKEPDRFPGSEDDLNLMIPYLRHEDLTALSDDMEHVRHFVTQALHTEASTRSSSMPAAFDKIHEFYRSGLNSTSEMIAGFGHIRMVYSGSKNEQRAIVNGPLFEVSVEAESLPDGDVLIRPTKDAEIALNPEVMTALTVVGGGESRHMKALLHAAKHLKVAELRFGDTKSYDNVLQTVPNLRSRGEYVSTASDQPVHAEPKDPDGLLVTDACCLFYRKKLSTTFSKDARRWIEALDQSQLTITEPLRALVSGPSYMDRYLSPFVGNNNKKIQEDDLVYPLAASKAQREVGYRLFVNAEPVLVLTGPPGKLPVSLLIRSRSLEAEVVSPSLDSFFLRRDG